MSATKNRIKVCSLEFRDPPFRKLGNIKIEFAERLTLIAGHNGIGKSTIQGLVANTFGVPRGGSRSYFGEPFYANIERIVYLALDEVAAYQSDSAEPIVLADVNGIPVRKRCAMTHRTEWMRARIVPRTIEKSTEDPVGQDAKIPLPTIFLGVKRLASVGEADERDVANTNISMPDEDRALMADFVSSVIIGSKVNTNVTQQTIKGFQKKNIQPGYDHHDASAVSIGQDSLASIATALASFNKLMREQGDAYPGGLLVIDELDIGLHPHAIDRLVNSLKTHAKRLKLQIIATTHSPRLIEAVHPEGGGSPNAPDKVVYIIDTQHPRLADDQSLSAILDDMALKEGKTTSTSQPKPILGVYFEDQEGAQFCGELITSGKRAALSRRLGVKIQLIPLGVGGSNLLGLPEKDPIFKDRLLVVDADTSIPSKIARRGNTVKLPCHKGAAGTDRSPENVIKIFLRAITEAKDGPLHQALLRLNVTNPTSDKVISNFLSSDSNSTQRESSKMWWINHWDKLHEWRVVQEWAKCHPTEAEAFVTAFEDAASKTAKRLTDQQAKRSRQ